MYEHREDAGEILMREYRVRLFRRLSSTPTVEVYTDPKMAHGSAADWVANAHGRSAVVEHREVSSWCDAAHYQSDGMTPDATQGTDAQSEAA